MARNFRMYGDFGSNVERRLANAKRAKQKEDVVAKNRVVLEECNIDKKYNKAGAMKQKELREIANNRTLDEFGVNGK